MASIQEAIAACGHEVVRLGGGREFLENVLASKVDFVFNIAEGRGTFRSREGQVPSILEMLGIPYTFSDPLTLGISLDKPLTKRMVAETRRGRGARLAGPERERPGSPGLRGPPLPTLRQARLRGVLQGHPADLQLRDRAALREVVRAMLRDYRQPVMVEGFVAGDEYTVGVLGNGCPEALGAMRIRPKAGADPDFVYSIEVKRDWEQLVAYDVPPPLDPATRDRLYADAVKAFEAIGCRDLARVDFRIRDGVPVFLEINPLPGLSPTYGDLPILCRGMGIPYQELMDRILNTAFRRCGLA